MKDILILMAEDSPTDAELARVAFKDGGIPNTLIIVPDGEEALAYMRKEGKYTDAAVPDLIILDLNMPRKDGRQVLVELKKGPHKQIPVVILTTSEDEFDIVSSYESSASCYVTKPVDFNKFLDVAKEIKSFFFKTVTLPPTGEALERR